MTQQPEAVENYIQQAITTERREWNKLTRELYAQIDTLMEQRDQLSELLNAERIARQGLAQLLKANH